MIGVNSSLIPSNKEPRLYLCDEKSINTYDLNTQSFMTLLESQEVGYTLSEMDPHHNNLVNLYHTPFISSVESSMVM